MLQHAAPQMRTHSVVLLLCWPGRGSDSGSRPGVRLHLPALHGNFNVTCPAAASGESRFTAAAPRPAKHAHETSGCSALACSQPHPSLAAWLPFHAHPRVACASGRAALNSQAHVLGTDVTLQSAGGLIVRPHLRGLQRLDRNFSKIGAHGGFFCCQVVPPSTDL